MSPTTGRGWAGLGWSPPAALFVHIVNIKFHNTFAFTVVTRPGCSSTLPRPRAGRSLELETKVAEDYAKFYNTIKEKFPTRAFSLLKTPTSI